ncbi:MAG: signal peptidase I [Pseudomonadota bacterium]
MSTEPFDTSVAEEELPDDELIPGEEYDPDAYLHPDDELEAYGEERIPWVAAALQLAGGAGYFYADCPRRFGAMLAFYSALVLAWYHGVWSWASHPLVYLGMIAVCSLAVLGFVADAFFQVSSQRYYWRKWFNAPWAYALFGAVGFLPLVLLVFLSMDEGRAVRTVSVIEGANTPTIQIGDRVILDMRAYDALGPQRGDVVYYRVRDDADTLYLNRVLGLPGDQIVFGNGAVSLNGKVLDRQEAGPFAGAHYTGDKQIVETVTDGPSYMTLISPNSSVQHDGRLYEVPPGHYFLVGDNRDSAWDSRFQSDHGYIARNNILGKGRGIVWSGSLERIGAQFP